MSKFKLVCTDIDGTLLNDHRHLSERTKKTLLRLWQDFGVPTVLVSSRMPTAMHYFLEEIPLKMPIVAYNGSLVLSEDKEIIYTQLFPSSIALEIYEYAADLDLHVGIYRYDEWYVEKDDFWTQKEINNTRVTPIFDSIHSVLLSFRRQFVNIHKMMIMGEAKKIKQMIKQMKRYSDMLEIYPSKDTHLDIGFKYCSKASGMKIMQEYFEVEPEETIAFGDNWNDVRMLKKAGHGVAMQNSPDGVKAIAKEIAPFHYEDGVAQILEKYF